MAAAKPLQISYTKMLRRTNNKCSEFGKAGQVILCLVAAVGDGHICKGDLVIASCPEGVAHDE